ncbi:MAG: GGDEF domain-containing protein [Hellea sp.]
MHKRDSLENAAGTSVRGESQSALRLLGAAPFLLRGQQSFIWQDLTLCKSLLKINNGPAPETAEDWNARLSPEGARDRAKAIRNLTWDGAQYAVSYKIAMDDARQIWVEERGERLSGEGARAAEISGVIVNIDSARQAQERAAYSASHDELTGLWNGARMGEGLNHIIAFAQRYGAAALCLRLELSNLSDINDNYGYEIGDSLLKSMASRLEKVIEPPDITARLSGASFAVGYYDIQDGDAHATAQSLNEALSGAPYPTPHGPLFVELKIGYTLLDRQARSASEALSQMRAALQSTSGSDDLIKGYLADMAISPQPRRAETSADDILTALNDRRMSLAFQPIIDAKTRDLHHYECLLRLRTDDGEVVSAGCFIMASERLGLVHMLDRRALELAGEALRQYPDIHIALNVSAGTVKDLATADAYIAALKALGPDVKRVTLELTETVALEDPAMASRFSVETRGLGCEFAIDDFGSGYTTFQNLMAIEADTIKIDGTFIEGIAHTPHKETFVRMMVDLAQTFGVKTVAEMVDSRADADLLKRLGVDYLQGYMFGIPSAAPAWRKDAS